LTSTAVSRRRSRRSSARARIATLTLACSRPAARTRSGRRSRRRIGPPGTPLWSPHDLGHRRISLVHEQGMMPLARIAEFVGQRDFTVTANTYTHVMVDAAELDYGAMLRDGAPITGLRGV
jgi:integrase